MANPRPRHGDRLTSETDTYTALGCQTVPAKEMQTDPHNLVGFGFMFALIAQVCTWFLCQVQMGAPWAERKP